MLQIGRFIAGIVKNVVGKWIRKNLFQEASGFGNGDRYIIDLPEEFYNPGINQMINSGVIIKLAEQGKGIDNDLTFLPAGE